MELWDLYNERRELTGRDHVRGQEMPEDAYHLYINVWIRNRKGQYLISQRAADRHSFPLMWESVGGSALKGENSLQCALRESEEEVGVVLRPESGCLVFTRLRKTENGHRYNDFTDVWLFEYDGEIDLERATTREVAQAKWMNREEIRRLYEAGKLVKSFSYFFERDEL